MATPSTSSTVPAVPGATAAPSYAPPTVTIGSASYPVAHGAAVSLTSTATADTANGLSIASRQWAVDSKPAGSAADAGSFSAATSANSGFATDVPGPYVLSMTVTDDKPGGAASAVARCVVVASAYDLPTCSVSTSDEHIEAGGTATLTATATKDTSLTLAHLWVVTRYVGGVGTVVTGAVLSSATSATPILTAEAGADGYVYDCADSVTDSAGQTATGRHPVVVSTWEAPTLVVSAAAEIVAPGGAVVLTATPTFIGAAVLDSYAWTCTRYDAAGAGTSQDGQLSTLIATPSTLTVEAGADDYRYRCVCVVTDDHGLSGVAEVSIRAAALEAPTGSIGDQQTVSSLDAFDCVEAGAPGITGATSYAWTAIQTADPNTSGVGPAGVFSDAAVQAPTFTPDWPCSVELTCSATGPGGVQTFRRAVKVNVVAPTAAIVAVTPQSTLAQVTLDSSASSAGITRAWTLVERSVESGAVTVTTILSSTTATAPTFTPRRRDADYLAVLVVTDAYGRTATASTVVHVGDRPSSVTGNTPTVATAV